MSQLLNRTSSLRMVASGGHCGECILIVCEIHNVIFPAETAKIPTQEPEFLDQENLYEISFFI